MREKTYSVGMSLLIINIVNNGGNLFNWLKKLFDNTEPEATGVRARNSKGHFVKDDASTPNVNEAYADGKTPKRKPRKKPAAKKAPAKKAPAKRGRPKKTTAKK